MNILVEFFKNFLELANAMSIYILVGLFIAGLIKQFIADDFISSHLGDSSIGSVIKATLLGIPLPVCSCSVIPLANSLKKEGASSGAVQSFLISTPITGVDSIMVTYSFFGIFFTIYRIVTAVVMAIIVGILENSFGNKIEKEILTPKVKSCCSEKKESKKFSIKEVFRYAYVTLFGDMAKALLLGLLLGAAFTTFLPKEMLVYVFGNQILTYFLVLVIALPMYVCATSSLPIVAGLMMSGMSIGAGFVFLSAGAATNSLTMGVIIQMLGKKSLAIYLGVITSLSIVFGVILDTFLKDISIINHIHQMENSSVINIIGSIIMLTLIAYFVIKSFFVKDSCCSDSSNSCCSNSKETDTNDPYLEINLNIQNSEEFLNSKNTSCCSGKDEDSCCKSKSNSKNEEIKDSCCSGKDEDSCCKSKSKDITKSSCCSSKPKGSSCCSSRSKRKKVEEVINCCSNDIEED